ncbi:HAD family phosphatase [Microbispora sp. RL4-1S]|uniref:HAD family phosphatase n=1 Tax=Microbispora oryzae TaxID=2806554 RepID=A0A940WJY1_9ACTN|nr:HAD family phosphatase [Microbispora oryzae]MBP2702900.1 HAD family phosphatase [Microbispora oryzae]
MPDELADGPSAVLFDMDGTLVDTEGLWWEACAEVASGLGAPLPAADQEVLFGLAAEDAAEHVSRRAGGDPPPAAVTTMLTDAFTARVKRGVTTLPGTVALLDALRAAGIPAGLVSASPRAVVDLVLEAIGEDRFRLSVAAGDSARNKPAPDPYLAAARRLGVDPVACVAVEDSPTGIASARAAGCAVVVVGSPYRGVSGRMVRVPSLERVDLPMLRLLAATARPGDRNNGRREGG